MGKIAIPRSTFSVCVSTWALVQYLQDGVVAESVECDCFFDESQSWKLKIKI